MAGSVWNTCLVYEPSFRHVGLDSQITSTMIEINLMEAQVKQVVFSLGIQVHSVYTYRRDWELVKHFLKKKGTNLRNDLQV